MKIAELLRSLADKLETIEKGDDRPVNTGPTGDHFQHDVEDGAESGDKDVELAPGMVPPLQQKLEILKKLSGEADQPDELDDIKKLTGIQTVIHADDTDLDGQ